MAQQPTSMIGHMYVAAQKTLRIVAAPLAFVAKATMQAAERLIPQGAAEVGQALYGGGNAYAPPGLTERVVKPNPPKVAPVADYNRRLQQAAARIPQAPDKGRTR